MKKQLFIFISFIIGLNNLFSQKDTIKRDYLIYTLKGTNIHNFIKENKKIVLKDKYNHRVKGNLQIINDSTIAVLDPFLDSINYDTFNLNDIKFIRPNKTIHKLGSVCVGLVSFIVIFTGKISYDVGFEGAGIFIMAMGTAIGVESVLLYNGSKLKSKRFKYSVLTTDGYKLKKRDLKKIMRDKNLKNN